MTDAIVPYQATQGMLDVGQWAAERHGMKVPANVVAAIWAHMVQNRPPVRRDLAERLGCQRAQRACTPPEAASCQRGCLDPVQAHGGDACR